MLPFRLAYRIENSKFKGPWCADDADGGMYSPMGRQDDIKHGERHYSAYAMPTTGEDRRLRRAVNIHGDNELHAFPSVQVLRQWFCPATLAYLHTQDHALTVLAVPWEDHTLYANQLTFRIGSERRLRRVPLLRLIGVPFVRATSTRSHAIL